MNIQGARQVYKRKGESPVISGRRQVTRSWKKIVFLSVIMIIILCGKVLAK
jgi:hypothetical protein